MAVEISVCVPVYRAHPEPNVATLAAALPAALGDRTGELVVALNGIAADEAGVPDGVKTVPSAVNLGVAPGWNAAAREASGDIMVFGNDDAELGPGSLAALARALEEHPEAGVVGPVGSTWDRERWEHVDMVHPADGDGLVECDVVSGFLFACRRETWEALGGFDEAYAPASWEEVDFNVAAQARGLKSYAVGGVQVAHEWGISARQPPWRRVRWGGRSELLWSIHRRNRRHFLGKWSHPPAP
jgi:O-antigen biosynthesis protein